MISSEILKIDILNLQGKQPQGKTTEAKDGIAKFKDIIIEKLDINANKSSNIEDSDINIVENNSDDNISNLLNKLLLATNGSQIENNSCTDEKKLQILLLSIVERLKGIMDNKTSNEVLGKDSKNIELLNRLFTNENKHTTTEVLGFKLTEDKKDQIKIILNKLDSALSGEVKEKHLKENPKVFRQLFNIKREVQKLQPEQLYQISLEDLSSLNKITESTLDKAKVEPDNILAALSPILEKLQSIVVNKATNEGYGEKALEELSALKKMPESDLHELKTEPDNTLEVFSSMVKKVQSIVVNEKRDESYGEDSNITENLNLKLTLSENKEFKQLGEVLTKLFTELNGRKSQGSVKENTQVVNTISNITEALEKLETKQLEQIPLENLSSLKQIVTSTLDELKTKPDNISAALSPMMEKLQSILVNKTNEDESNSNSSEKLDLKLTSSKKKELRELGEVLTKLNEEHNGGKFEESLKENPQIVNVVSDIIKDLENFSPEQLEEISLENLSSLKKIAISASDKVMAQPDNIFQVLSPIEGKIQSIAVNKISNKSYDVNSKDNQLLSELLANENYLNSKDIQFLRELILDNNEPSSNMVKNLNIKLASSKKTELKELGEVLTNLVTELSDVNLEESLKQSPQITREISNITKELARLGPKQLEQISLDDLNALKEMVKSVLNVTKASQFKKPLRANLVSANNDMNLEYEDFNKADDYLREDLSVNTLGFKVAKKHNNSEFTLVKDENTLNNKEDSLLKKIISGSEKKNEHISMFTQRFNEVKNINQVKNDITINKNTMVNDVVKTIKYMTENNERTLTVKMNPKDLGEITIKIVAQGESMKATITAASRDTAILLNANEMEMKKMLDAQGVKISEVNISLYNDDTTFFREQTGFGRENENHRQNENQNTTVANQELEDERLNEVLDNTNNINMFA